MTSTREGKRPLLSQTAKFQMVAISQARLFLPARGKGNGRFLIQTIP
ncbi:MAG: hypothetical protein M5U34_29350 [Chloroflexi bacterium]|nr:hypothetical protein [Chloroflexota bacterium]